MYKLIEGSKGIAPHFAITCGLREGYGPDGTLHTVEEVVELVQQYLMERAAVGLPFLTGTVTTGTLVYAWSKERRLAGGANEPQATFSGEKNPLYNATLATEQVIKFLNGLASTLGEALGQTRVYVAYDGEMWILQKENTVTPKGETV